MSNWRAVDPHRAARHRTAGCAAVMCKDRPAKGRVRRSHGAVFVRKSRIESMLSGVAAAPLALSHPVRLSPGAPALISRLPLPSRACSFGQ